MKCLILLLVVISICNVLGKIPAPEPPTEPEDQASAIPRDFTEEELKFHEQVYKDMPNLPRDTFKIVPTSFRKKKTKEDIEAEKKKREEEKEREEREMHKKLVEDLEQTYKKLEKMDPKDIDKMQKELSEDLKQVDKKIAKGEL